MFTTNTLSRIARTLTLRRAELTAHAASLVAVTLTALLVGANYAAEANPFPAFLIATSSPKAWPLVTPLLVAAWFAGLRWVRDHDDPRAALVLGWVFAIAVGVGQGVVTPATGCSGRCVACYARVHFVPHS